LSPHVRGGDDRHGGDDFSGYAHSDGRPDVGAAVAVDIDAGGCAAVGIAAGASFGAAAAPDEAPSASRHSCPETTKTALTSAYRSGTGELEERLDVAIIRRFDRLQIFHACLTFFDQIGGTPSKYGAAKLQCEHICDQAGMPTVAVRKWMNVYKSMVKANSYFVGGVRAVLDPIPNVTAQRHESVSNFMDWNPNVFLGASVLTRPLPCLIEHLCVQLPHVFVGSDTNRTRAICGSPLSRQQYVFALPFV
jgi:hypothetical protein